MVMSGEARRAYHGVPRVLANSFKGENKFEKCKLDGNHNQEYHVENYLKEHRININTRQVYK